MPNPKEAKARIKINKLLERAGWRFFDDNAGPANIQLEPNVKIKKADIDKFGDNFEKTKSGFVDYLLLGEDGYPLVVLEAKNDSKNPLDGKEQARQYAQSLKVRFVILSNGDLHYFWDLEYGNPEIITELPEQESMSTRKDFKPNNRRLADEEVNADYIALTQNHNYKNDPDYLNEATREEYLHAEELQILRPYQLEAIHKLQQSAQKRNTRFLFEMATGTGKTLVSGAVIKLFLRTGNAKRVLFLVDRLELEEQAHKSFIHYLKNDYFSVIYKYNKDDWKKAEIVISTVQSLAAQDKYKKFFSPTDFDLVISDEAHRSINGNSRAVFEYFIGYKLGLTATPKDYLKNIEAEELSGKGPRAWERRQLMDTYTTFGCDSGEPTFRYTLIDSVKKGYLVNPIAIDARTDITTDLLSEKGYAVIRENEEGEEIEETYYMRDFERKFFSEKTNRVFCKAILDNALRDPISNEFGKTIVFCISQSHASKITQILNEMAYERWSSKYNSDFAVQVTSNVVGAQEMTVKFSNNNLNGYTKFIPEYKSSKTRVCVTVGMMTTGYDCKDILNLALLRPVFSPTDFVQMKGRGTRRYNFEYENENGEVLKKDKEGFKFFDFFANFEYFEEKFNYDGQLTLPNSPSIGHSGEKSGSYTVGVEISDPDKIKKLTKTVIGPEGMKVDRKLFEKASKQIRADESVKQAVEYGQWDEAIKIMREKYEDKPELFLTLEKIRRGENLDRQLTWREFLERVFGVIDGFKTKDEQLEDELQKFFSIYKPDSKYEPYIRNYFKAYVCDACFRKIIDDGHLTDLATYPGFPLSDYKKLNSWGDKVPKYIKDYVQLKRYTE